MSRPVSSRPSARSQVAGSRGRDATAVYASADEGENFTEVASHLPDVLCVRAAVVVGSAAPVASP